MSFGRSKIIKEYTNILYTISVTMDQLWPELSAAIRQRMHSINRDPTPELLEKIRQLVISGMDNELFDPGDNVTDDINNVLSRRVVIEIDTPQKHYAGYHHETGAGEMATRCGFPVYQIIFEDREQKLVFEFVGDDHEKLKTELEKIYPGCPIGQAHDDYTIGKTRYANYKEASSEFDKMRTTLDKIDHKLAYQCHKKELSPVNGTNRMATRMKLQPIPRISDMVFGTMVFNINIANNMMVGNHNNMHVNQPAVPSREDLHRQWIENNPPGVCEGSSVYYTRAKQALVKACSLKKQSAFLQDIGYYQKHTGSVRTWVLDE